jgi:folate-binding protein YgfZ
MPSAESPTDRIAAEYAAARQAVALIDLPERGVLAATGPQRQKFLHNILSNDIEGLTPGQGTLAALMDVKGHLLALMRALVTPDAVLLEMPKDRLALVKERLLFYKVGAPVRFEEREAAILALIGPRAKGALAKAGLDAAAELKSEGHVEGRLGDGPARVARAGDLPAGGYVVHTATEQADAVRKALIAAGALEVARQTFDVLRIEDGRPFYGPDVAEEHLLHETGLLREYHSPSKGCYIGQEVVARLEGRGGNVSRLLRGLRLGAPAAAGEAVLQEGRVVGRLTTSGVSPRSGPIALAFLHRSAYVPGAAVLVAGKPATVVALPFEAEPAP